MADMMNFPKRWEDFLHNYEFEDSRRVYTNGSRLIQSFRVEQMMEHYALRPVSREQVEKVWRGEWKHYLPPLGAGDVQCRCTRCGRTPDVETPFCAWCGAPMTDGAVEMVMRRLEALHGET